MLKSIIWDFDGTLIDTYPEMTRLVNEAVTTFGKTVTLERVTELSCISVDFCIRELAKEFTISYEALLEQFNRVYDTIKREEQCPFPGVVDVCKTVQATGGRNFIVTHRRKKSLFELLETHALRPYFTDIVAGDDGFPKKPDPQAMRYLLDKYQLPPVSVLVVGDRDIDIRAGQSLGVKTCLFRASFPELEPDLTIKDFSELLAHLLL
jgi:HAD superfamily hydrolase (TIGR01549 family)